MSRLCVFLTASSLMLVAAPAQAGPATDLAKVANAQVGVKEKPAGSNRSVRIDKYWSAVRGGQTGAPWSAAFVSWVAREAGHPIASGFGSSSQIRAWAMKHDRLLSPSDRARPGDLLLIGDAHVGVVVAVTSKGVTTVEGNYSNQVAKVQRSLAGNWLVRL
jgi:hypothetical protein